MRMPFRLVLVLLACLVFAVGASAAQVRAIPGEPFGVAEITLRISSDDAGLPIGRAAMALEGPAGRIHYPAFNEGVIDRLLGGGSRPGANLNVMFLFRGDTPFEVTIATPSRQKVTVIPVRRTRTRLAHRLMLRQWWRAYHGMFRDDAKRSEHPELVETYLTSMLARRLGLDDPLIERLGSNLRDTEDRRAIEMLLGTQAARMRVMKATSLGQWPLSGTADQPLPADVDWQQPELPVVANDVVIEPIAMHIPAECFYIRFGQFSNYLWLSSLLQEYGGEIENMVSAQSYSTHVHQRIQDQLVLHEGVLTRVLGPQVIADFAVIGTDTFVADGIALGVVFEATSKLLGVEIQLQRQAAVADEEEASIETVKIGGKDVSFLSTPDNRLRSFYLVDGSYHLVTNSRAIVERFLSVRDGEGSLGASEEFRYARSILAANREDTIFAHFSSAFFRNVLSPHYQIEQRRRLQAASDMDLIRLARLAAKAEGVPGETIKDLVGSALLPERFGNRPDRSRPVIADGNPVISDANIVDSLRGGRGVFTPVGDVLVDKVSIDERRWYEQQASYVGENWRRMDPIFVALKRTPLPAKNHERLTVDAYIAPLDDRKYERWTSMLDTPPSDELIPPEDNIIWIDAALRGGVRFPNVPSHRLFLGVQDREPLTESKAEDVLKLRRILRTGPGYLGAWPKPGFLDLIPTVPGTESDQELMQLPLGLLRWHGRDFSVLAFDQEILTQVGEQLQFEGTEQLAQIRVRVGDLSQAKFYDWLNQMGYERARQASLNNTRFMSILTQQFYTPLTESRRVAEELLGAELVCPLGGKYEIAKHRDGQVWQSSAWPSSPDSPLPDGYVAPILHWFRGLEGQLWKRSGQLSIHGHIDMQRM